MKKIYESPSYVLIDIAKEDVIRTSFGVTEALNWNEEELDDFFSWQKFV